MSESAARKFLRLSEGDRLPRKPKGRALTPEERKARNRILARRRMRRYRRRLKSKSNRPAR